MKREDTMDIKSRFARLCTCVVLMSALVFTGCSGSAKTGSEEQSSSKQGSVSASDKQDNQNYRTVKQIKKSGKLIIGVFCDKEPFGYLDEKGDYKGYDVFLAEKLAEDMGVSAEFIPVDPTSRIDSLTSGKVDVVLANFTVTDERSEQVQFAKPYMKIMLGVVSPKKALIRNISQLKNKKLIVVEGTTAEEYFAKKYPEVELQKYDEYTQAYQALQYGMGDGLCTDNMEALAWTMDNKDFEVGMTKIGDVDKIAPAVHKDNDELVKWLDEEIDKLAEEKFFYKDFEQTLKSVYGDKVEPEDIIIE